MLLFMGFLSIKDYFLIILKLMVMSNHLITINILKIKMKYLYEVL